MVLLCLAIAIGAGVLDHYGWPEVAWPLWVFAVLLFVGVGLSEDKQP